MNKENISCLVNIKWNNKCVWVSLAQWKPVTCLLGEVIKHQFVGTECDMWHFLFMGCFMRLCLGLWIFFPLRYLLNLFANSTYAIVSVILTDKRPKIFFYLKRSSREVKVHIYLLLFLFLQFSIFGRANILLFLFLF